MNIAQITLLKRMISGNLYQAENVENLLQTVLYAAQYNSAGGKANENSDKSDINASHAIDEKRGKKDDSGKAQSQEVTNKDKDGKENASITQPDTNLTGDTGNLDIGQTDLGASGTGAEDL